MPRHISNEIAAVIKPLEADILAVPEGQRWLVSCEGAFSYLIRDFQMQELYLWPINADQQGTPQQVRKVIDGVRANNIPAVFCESTVSQSPAQQVARETDATYRWHVVCGQPDRGRWRSADLYRPAAHHHRNNRHRAI